jgi:hypothetical protein
MGIGTMLGMHNLSTFLYEFAERLPKNADVKIESHESTGNRKLKSHGFSPGLIYLKITKGERVLIEVDASEEDFSDSAGEAELKAAINAENMDLALELYSKLIE